MFLTCGHVLPLVSVLPAGGRAHGTEVVRLKHNEHEKHNKKKDVRTRTLTFSCPGEGILGKGFSERSKVRKKKKQDVRQAGTTEAKTSHIFR